MKTYQKNEHKKEVWPKSDVWGGSYRKATQLGGDGKRDAEKH